MADYDGIVPNSLQPWAHAATQPKSFATVLGRIYNERGHFRHITEAQLRDEIATQAVSGAGSPSETESDNDDTKSDAESRLPRAERLAQARREVLEHVASAQNEVLLARDFVSLLLSKDVKAAESTISPILKQSVPSGTLGMDIWDGMAPDTQREETDRLLARGKRMECLNQSANALMAAGERLKSTVDRERRYWDEVLRIRQSGWSLCRMPREKGLLGVRYGFSEARGEFARRGLAALRMGSEGDIVLDRGLGMEGKALRVRVIQNSAVTAESSIKTSSSTDDGLSDIEGRIRTARDSFFEEELWHEAMREARTLSAYRVNMRGNTIVLPLDYSDPTTLRTGSTSSNIEIDLTSTDDAIMDAGSSVLAESVATALRLLLSHVHRQRLEQRAAIPPPISNAKPEKPFAAIVRPLLSNIHHHAAVKQLEGQLSTLLTALNGAKVNVQQSPNDALTEALDGTTTANALLSLLCAPRETTTTVEMTPPQPSSSTSDSVTIKIRTTTALNPPASHGTIFALACDTHPTFSHETSSLTSLGEQLRALVASVLASAAAAWVPGWEVDIYRAKVLRPVGKGKGAASEINVRVDEIEGGTQLIMEAGNERFTWGGEGSEQRGFDEVMSELVEKIR